MEVDSKTTIQVVKNRLLCQTKLRNIENWRLSLRCEEEHLEDNSTLGSLGIGEDSELDLDCAHYPFNFSLFTSEGVKIGSISIDQTTTTNELDSHIREIYPNFSGR